MSTLEDKILGEKTHNYCSSSEEESNDESSDNEKSAGRSTINHLQYSSNYSADNVEWNGVSSNTGPKGVIKDWERFMELENEKRNEKLREQKAMLKKTALTCRSAREEEEEELAEIEKDLKEIFSDQFMENYRKKRMKEMMSRSRAKLPKFGKLIHLSDGAEFLKAVDEEHKAVTVIVHIYENNVSPCKLMNQCLSELSDEYNKVKFCKLIGSSAGMSNKFKTDGVPALLVYKGGLLVGNFVRVTDDLGDEFFSGDVENYLIEHGMINDKACIPKIISQIELSDSDG